MTKKKKRKKKRRNEENQTITRLIIFLIGKIECV
jgi:hypothetical protein